MKRTTGLRAALALGALVSTACQANELQFHNDHRLSFNAPRARQLVTVPLSIRWSMKDFTASGLDGATSARRGVFAVFVDRAPMPVGKNLKWLAHGDQSCKRDPRCPDAAYLANRDVHITTDASLRLPVLPRLNAGVGDEQHFVTVVLLDGTGRRIGESAWYRAFRTTRRPGS